MTRPRPIAGRALGLLLLCTAASAPAATCTWTAPSGNWSAVGNWTGCADLPGPSTRTPGASDIAVVAAGAASLDIDATVGEFEIAGSASLTLVGGGARTLTVGSALRLAGGTVTTTNTSSFPILYLVIAPGATGQVPASSTLANTVELQNNGQLQLQSATGTTLTFQGLARLVNLPGSTFAVGGGNARVHLDGLVPLTVQAGATLATSGTVFIGKTLATPGAPRIESFGTVEHTGPGTLTIQGAGSGTSAAATLQVQGLLTIRNGGLLCNALADTCRLQQGAGGSSPLRIALDNGQYGRGGPTAPPLFINTGSDLVGSGSVDGAAIINGQVSPGADSGAPYGTLAVTGALQFNGPSELALDVGGSAPGTHDRVQAGGALSFGNAGFPDGVGLLTLRLAPAYQPPIGEQVAAITYASVGAGSAVYRVDANYALDYATRFEPTALQVFPAPRLFVEATSVVEGNAGSVAVNLNVRLSQPSTLPVSAQLKFTQGTATQGALPAGDYSYTGATTVQFAPGEVVRPVQIQVHGDLAAEADEAFTLGLVRNTVVNAAVGNGVPGDPGAAVTILTDDLPPDTRFVLVAKDTNANGSIRRYTSTGTLVDTWGPAGSQGGGGLAAGLCFGPGGTILSTRFTHTNPLLYSGAGAVLDLSFARRPGEFLFNQHESCTFDRDGNVYIGQAGGATSPDDTVPVLKFDRRGVPLETFVLPTGPRGTDWIELGGDQCTLYYTSEDTVVRRYNVCTRTVLPDFAVGLTPPVCYALRLRPNRELMVACQDAVHRLSPQGANLQTYTRQSLGETNVQGLFAINLDPDGTSFWTAGLVSGQIYRVDIASGAVLASFSSGPGTVVGGLAIYDQLGDDTIFLDGFEAAPVPAPIVASGPSSHLYREMRRCEKEFSLRNVPLPHYVPYWLSLVVIGANDCWH
jgi:hypothetical protein